MKRTNGIFFGKILVLIALVCAGVMFASCSNAATDNDSDPVPPDDPMRLNEYEQKLLGKWMDADNSGFELKSDKTVDGFFTGDGSKSGPGSWSATATEFTISGTFKFPDMRNDVLYIVTEYRTISGTYTINGNTITFAVDYADPTSYTKSL